ncbi:MAG: hypothetical protein AAGA08_01800 [Pseudomonadota bacterium]
MADFDQVTLFQLVTDSDTIFLGEVLEAGADNFRVRMAELVKGREIASELLILSAESAPPGAQVVIFATRQSGKGFRPLGFAGEGVLAVEDGMVILESLKGTGKAAQDIGSRGEIVRGYPVPLDAFAGALIGFFQCYSQPSSEQPERASGHTISRTCNDGDLDAFNSQPWPAGYFADIARKLTEDH